MKSKFTIGVFAAIFDENNRILCVKRNYADKKWTIPGGAMDSGETTFEALIREVKEESGYIVDPESLKHISTYVSTHKDDIVFLIKAEVVDRQQWNPDGEISEVGAVCKGWPVPALRIIGPGRAGGALGRGSRITSGVSGYLPTHHRGLFAAPSLAMGGGDGRPEGRSL